MNRFDPRRRQFLAALASLPVAARARPGNGAPALVLAHEAPPDVDPSGFLVSEKLDGVRAFWDGRRFLFRSGVPIPAPAWFIERLPPVALDGELWLGRGRFEALSGAVRRQSPDDAAWRALRYMVFELPVRSPSGRPDCSNWRVNVPGPHWSRSNRRSSSGGTSCNAGWTPS
jgi:DNA ligase 1